MHATQPWPLAAAYETPAALPPSIMPCRRILVSVDQDIISLDVPRSADEAKQSMHFKDSMRERALSDIATAWGTIVATYAGSAPEVATAALETVQRCGARGLRRRAEIE